jgi:hypothetical protein
MHFFNRQHTLWLFSIGAAFALCYAACGSDSAATNGGTGTATVAGATKEPGTAGAGEECTSDLPAGLHSTTHRVNVPTTDQVIKMSWRAPGTPPDSYAYAFSQDPRKPPDQMETATGDATSAASGPLGQNPWYFYLRETRGGGAGPVAVRCGPYIIERGAGGDEPDDGGTADAVTLAISVSGGSSVEYFNTKGERLFCGDTSRSGHDVTCTEQFDKGSQVRIQRTLSLPIEEEARWRLSAWGGACDGIDADTEPRGGLCQIELNEDTDVSVTFESRPTITITHAGPPQLLLRWSIDYRPVAQKGGGNPLTLHGTFDCDTDMLAACTKTAYFDAGTTVILKAGGGVDAPNFAGWGGACGGTESTCEIVLEGDSTVTYNWKY